MTVSSILPPGCVELEKDAGVATLHPGEVTFAVMARTETNEPGRRINASIGLARPSDASMYGYNSEHHGYGKEEVESGDCPEDLDESSPAYRRIGTAVLRRYVAVLKVKSNPARRTLT